MRKSGDHQADTREAYLSSVNARRKFLKRSQQGTKKKARHAANNVRQLALMFMSKLQATTSVVFFQSFSKSKVEGIREAPFEGPSSLSSSSSSVKGMGRNILC